MKNLTVNMPLAVPHQRPPSKYASHPYPALVDEDVYISAISPLDVTKKQILMSVFEDRSYQSSVTPLDVVFKPLLTSMDVFGVYKSSLTPLDINLTPSLIRKDVSDSYLSSLKPLDVVRKTVVITYKHADDSVYKSTIKPLGITLEKG